MVYDKIVEICRAQKISITKVEDMANLGHGTIGKWKNVDPQIGNIRKVASVLNVSIEELVSDSKG